MNFGIIGAGPAGIFSALMIKEQNPENTVVIFDGNQKIGRKLFATGNGRCNITNMNAGPESYYSVKPEDLSPAEFKIIHTKTICSYGFYLDFFFVLVHIRPHSFCFS